MTFAERVEEYACQDWRGMVERGEAFNDDDVPSLRALYWLHDFAVQSAAVAAFGLRDRGLKPASSTRHKRLAILEGATRSKPGALLEVCFVSNPRDVEEVFGDTAREARIEFWQVVFSALLPKTTSGRTEL